MDFDLDLYLLSKKFAHDYPSDKYPDILSKHGRPYTCLLINTHDDFLICVPFRSNIPHSNAFLFSDTGRSQKKRSGLDYSKIVIIKDTGYIDSSSVPVVDHDEYKQMVQKLPIIVQEVDDYVDTYISHVTGTAVIHPREFERKYRYSTLPYFHDIMGIPDP